MKYTLLTTMLLIPLLMAAQLYDTKIYETDQLRFVVTADCRIEPYEGQFVKNSAGPSMLDGISMVTVSKNPAGRLAMAINSPISNAQERYKPGFSTDGETVVYLDKVFAVTGVEIREHIRDYEEDGQIDLINPNIFGWPAEGNRFFQEYHEGVDISNSRDLAKFIDQNYNGVYEPDKGDFPMYELGVYFEESIIPEQLFWTSVIVVIDGLPYPSNSVNMTTYSFGCEDNPLVNQTFFTDIEILNLAIDDMQCLALSTKSRLASQNVFLSTTKDHQNYLLTDTDTENFNCYIQQHLWTSFVADAANRNCDGALDTVAIKSTFDNVLASYDNSLPGQYLDSLSTASEYHSALSQGLWPDGTPLTVGGDGYNPDSQDSTFFAFEGDLRENDWNEVSTTEHADQKQNIYSTLHANSLQASGRPLSKKLAHSFISSTSTDMVYDQIDNLREVYNLYIWNSERWEHSGLCSDPTSPEEEEGVDSILTVLVNPIQQHLYFSSEVEKVKFYNTVGILEYDFTGPASNIDLADLRSGLHFVVLEHNGVPYTFKIIKR